jgi:DNA-binding NtrC family response regulator
MHNLLARGSLIVSAEADRGPASRDGVPGHAFARLNLLGNSPLFLEALYVIEKIAVVDATVLIQGETGTGKELAARALHYLSPRRDRPFIPVNCGALPDNLIESELFGHERGAFTDAKNAHRGIISQGEGGTLFFDEVEAMTPRGQAVLLRFLQDQKYRPVGGRLEVTSNVRIIASSNLDLEELVRANQFRRDLLFRFRILSVTMPPLRLRERDVVTLAEHFLHRFAVQYGRPAKRLHPDAVTWLLTHDWPGNVRELENLILREFLLAEGDVIRLRTPGEAASDPGMPDDFADEQTFKRAKVRAVEAFEKAYLGDLLAKTGGNIALAARLSRKDRSALNKLVKKHGLGIDRFRTRAS